MKTYCGSGGIAPRILTLALDGVEWSSSHIGYFTLKEIAPGILSVGGWVGSRAGLDMMAKRKIPSPLQESNSITPLRNNVTDKHYHDVCPWQTAVCEQALVFETVSNLT
jgi:hypothetical protein